VDPGSPVGSGVGTFGSFASVGNNPLSGGGLPENNFLEPVPSSGGLSESFAPEPVVFEIREIFEPSPPPVVPGNTVLLAADPVVFGSTIQVIPNPNGAAIAAGDAKNNIFVINNGFVSSSTDSDLIQNGGFETGDLTDWSKEDTGSGTFNVTSANTAPISNKTTVGASSGTFYAVTGQTGAGAHAIGQSFLIDASSTSVLLTFDMFANSFAAVVKGADLLTSGGANQHARVDLLTSGSDLLSTINSNVIRNLFKGSDSGTNPNSYTSFTFDILNEVSGGGEFLIRFAQVDNRGFFTLGVDNVSIVSTISEISSFINGGDGADTVDFSAATESVRIDLKDGVDIATVGTIRHQLSSIEKIIGSALNDTIIVSGLDGIDIIAGRGTDTIDVSSGTGADIIRYNKIDEMGDTINGFASGSDSLHFGHSVGDSVPGVLPVEAFVKGASAVALDANDHFIFDTSNNTLSFDADGNGAGAAVTVATFDNSSLIHSDITLF
jgi:hypothetical protein